VLTDVRLKLVIVSADQEIRATFEKSTVKNIVHVINWRYFQSCYFKYEMSVPTGGYYSWFLMLSLYKHQVLVPQKQFVVRDRSTRQVLPFGLGARLINKRSATFPVEPSSRTACSQLRQICQHVGSPNHHYNLLSPVLEGMQKTSPHSLVFTSWAVSFQMSSRNVATLWLALLLRLLHTPGSYLCSETSYYGISLRISSAPLRKCRNIYLN
jgi:hypothetical protein